MPIPLDQLRQNYLDRLNIIRQNAPVDLKIAVPLNPKVTGKEGFFHIQWSPNLEAVDGYEVAISATNDITNPSIGTFRVSGPKSNFYQFHVGNNATTLFFAVRAFQGAPARFFSDWSTVVSATSVATTAAGAALPAAPSTVPSTQELPPAGERTGAGGRRGTA